MSCGRNTAQPLLRRLGARAVPSTPLARAMSTATEAPTSANAGTSRPSPFRRTKQFNSATSKFESRVESRRNAQLPPLAAPVKARQNLPELLGMLTKLKAEERTPTRAAYIALVRAAADYGARRGNNNEEGSTENTFGLEIALGAIRDAKAANIELGSEALDELFRFSFIQPEILPSLLIEIANSGKPTKAAYDTLGQHAVSEGRLEEVVVVFAEMLEHNLTPSRTVTKQLIRLACDWGLPRLALQVAERFEALPESLRIDSSAWVHILAASAQAQYLDGVDKAWGRTVVDKSYSPDEGLVLRILAVAGRWGRTRLAYDALACLPDIGVEAQEHHMAPLVEALCREGRVPDALKLVASIRKSGIVPTISTVQPIANVLTTPELLDQAFYAFEDMHKAGAVIDVAAFNAVIAAAQKLGDLQRARATQLAAADLGVTPDIHTFNYMIAACRSAGHYALGETLMAELAAAGLTPTAKTYEHMVHLALSQPEYEHVFYFLETMKSAGFKPRAPVYLAIGKKLARRQDERYKLVAEEMATLGYKAVDFVAEAAKPPRGGNRDRERGDRPERANRGGQRYDSNSSGDRRRQGADGGNGNRRPRRDQTQNQDQNQNSSE